MFRRFFVSLVLIGTIVGIISAKPHKHKVAYIPTVQPVSTPAATPVPTQTNIIYDNIDTFIGSIPQFTAAFRMTLTVDCSGHLPTSDKTFLMNINTQNYTERVTNGTITFTEPYGTYNISIANSCNTHVVIVRT